MKALITTPLLALLVVGCVTNSRIVTDPPGYRVSLNGVDFGKSPCDVKSTGTTFGRYDLQLSDHLGNVVFNQSLPKNVRVWGVFWPPYGVFYNMYELFPTYEIRRLELANGETTWNVSTDATADATLVDKTRDVEGGQLKYHAAPAWKTTTSRQLQVQAQRLEPEPLPKTRIPGPGKSVLMFNTITSLRGGKRLDLTWIFFCPSESSASASRAGKEKAWRDAGTLVKESEQVTIRELDAGAETLGGSMLQLLRDEPMYWPYLSFNDVDGNEGRMQVFGVGGKPDIALAVTEILAQQIKDNPLVYDLRIVKVKPRDD